MKTMKTIKQVPVKFIVVEADLPTTSEMSPNTIYYSSQYKCSTHLCLCGCGWECFLPAEEWSYELKRNNKGVTITPSIQQRFECKSHYIVTDGVANFI